jgi:hypothetical protein
MDLREFFQKSGRVNPAWGSDLPAKGVGRGRDRGSGQGVGEGVGCLEGLRGWLAPLLEPFRAEPQFPKSNNSFDIGHRGCRPSSTPYPDPSLPPFVALLTIPWTPKGTAREQDPGQTKAISRQCRPPVRSQGPTPSLPEKQARVQAQEVFSAFSGIQVFSQAWLYAF